MDNKYQQIANTQNKNQQKSTLITQEEPKHIKSNIIKRLTVIPKSKLNKQQHIFVRSSLPNQI